MIMISDMTLNNFTTQATPDWMSADNFGALLSQQEQDSLLRRIAALVKSKR